MRISLVQEVERSLDRVGGAAARIDALKRFKAIEEFKILVECVGDGSLETLQERLSLLADCCIRQAAAWTEPAPDGMNGTWLSMKLNGTK